MTAPAHTSHALDLHADVLAVTTALVDVPSVSRSEGPLADLVEAALRAVAHLEVERIGNTVVARTELARAERVVVAGHLDTVPPADNQGARLDESSTPPVLYGLGSCDMKGGVAVGLRLAATLPEPRRDVTYLFYECEEIDSEANGLTRLARDRPDLMSADFAILAEPTGGVVEGGCQGSLHAVVVTRGVRAHSARAWRGRNAIHAAGEVLDRLSGYAPREPVVDGLEFREGLNATTIAGGVAGNVIPDECRIGVNYRFAPDRSETEALEHVGAVFAGFDLELVDNVAGARPGLDRPIASEFAATVGGTPRAKFGWTDVARFSMLGVPAVNYGPGDPSVAHSADERVPVDQLYACEDALRRWLA